MCVSEAPPPRPARTLPSVQTLSGGATRQTRLTGSLFRPLQPLLPIRKQRTAPAKQVSPADPEGGAGNQTSGALPQPHSRPLASPPCFGHRRGRGGGREANNSFFPPFRFEALRMESNNAFPAIDGERIPWGRSCSFSLLTTPWAGMAVTLRGSATRPNEKKNGPRNSLMNKNISNLDNSGKP